LRFCWGSWNFILFPFNFAAGRALVSFWVFLRLVFIWRMCIFVWILRGIDYTFVGFCFPILNFRTRALALLEYFFWEMGISIVYVIPDSVFFESAVYICWHLDCVIVCLCTDLGIFQCEFTFWKRIPSIILAGMASWLWYFDVKWWMSGLNLCVFVCGLGYMWVYFCTFCGGFCG
jgi:hypothetical protein